MKTKNVAQNCQCDDVFEKEFKQRKQESLIFQFHHIHNAIFRVANKIINESSVPIKMEQIPVLMTLYWQKEQSQQQVADKIGRDKSSVLRTVLALEKKGLLIANKKDSKDGRRKVLALTKTGEFVAVQITDIIKNVENEIASALTERPKTELLDSLKKAAEKLDFLANS